MGWVKGTQGFICCSFKAVSLATLNKQMLSPFATYDALSLVITKPSFIWFGSKSVDICNFKKHILRHLFLNMKSTTFEKAMKKLLCPFLNVYTQHSPFFPLHFGSYTGIHYDSVALWLLFLYLYISSKHAILSKVMTTIQSQHHCPLLFTKDDLSFRGSRRAW